MKLYITLSIKNLSCIE